MPDVMRLLRILRNLFGVLSIFLCVATVAFWLHVLEWF